MPKGDCGDKTASRYALRYDHAVALEELKTEEHHGKTWYLVDVEGKVGRIEKTESLEIVGQHDWARLGFQKVQENDPNHDGFLDPGLISGVFLEIYKAIDADGNRQLSLEELAAAKDNPMLKDVWSKLIAYHPTEWRRHEPTLARFRSILTAPDIPPSHREYGRNLLTQETLRMQRLSFWHDLNPRLPESLYHFHPVRFVECFSSLGADLKCKGCGTTITLTEEFLKKVMPRAQKAFMDELILCSTKLFQKYGVDTCRQIKHLLAQAKKETAEFTAFRESLNYSRRTYTAQSLYRMARTAIDNGFTRRSVNFPGWNPEATRFHAEKMAWIDANLLGNDAGYGEHCFGANKQSGKDFRGRGLIHLTHYDIYQRCARETGHPIDSQPELVESSPRVIIETGLWFWKNRNISAIANIVGNSNDEGVRRVTRVINPGLEKLADRQRYRGEITAIFDQTFSCGCIG